MDPSTGNRESMSKQITVGKVAGNINIGEAPEYGVGSAINELLLNLAGRPFTFQRNCRTPSSKTVVKIKHNNLKSKSHIIKQYLDHSKKIEEAYGDIDAMIPSGKEVILQSLNDLYYQALDTVSIEYLCQDIDVDEVRDNSEFILDFIISKLKGTAFESSNTPSLKESINLGVNVVVAHAFIECVIMENPSNDSD